MESLSPAAGARALSLSGRSLLYAEDRQQLLELNPAADLIWRSFTDTGSALSAVRELCALGHTDARARALVDGVARRWMLEGYLAPPGLERRLSGTPADRTIVLDELTVELRVQGLPCAATDAVFGHLYAASAAGPRRRVTVIAVEDVVLLYLERRLVRTGGRGGWVADLKAVLTELYLETAAPGFLTHAALLAKSGRRLALAGAPGAGKTTLALALAAAGWAYGSDDIVRISPQAAVTGVPFAAAIKAGSLPLLRASWPGLADLAPWVRGDGQRARYLLPSRRLSGAPGPLDIFVVLARRPGAGARTRPLSTLDALAAILEAGCARRWRMNADAMAALAVSLERAVCVRLEYDALAAAVTCLEGLVRDEAQPA